jgi:hypothetical protein
MGAAFLDAVTARGGVEWIVRDPCGRIVRRGKTKNKTNVNALSALTQWAVGVASNIGSAGTVVPYPTQMQLGTGTGTPSATDNGLFAPAPGTLVPITNWSVYQNYYAQYVAYWGSTTPAGNYTEAVLLDPNGFCWAHVLLQTSANQPYVPIQSGQTLTIIWKLQLLGN